MFWKTVPEQERKAKLAQLISIHSAIHSEAQAKDFMTKELERPL